MSGAEEVSASLPDDLNTFFARFESYSPAEEVQKDKDPCQLVTTRADVCKSFNRINPHKAPGPDGIPGQALRVCADQLAGLFTDIFNTSLLQSGSSDMSQKVHHRSHPQMSKSLRSSAHLHRHEVL